MISGQYSTYKKIISNFSYLTVLQVSNLIVPIITYPLLIKNLGDVNYGKVVYAQAIVTYFSLLVNFGFNIIGTKEVSINRDNTEELNKVINGIFQLKFLLLLVSVALLQFCLYLLHVTDYLLYLFSFWVCLNELLLPVWYFQGIEKMRNITIISIFNRLLILILIILFIREHDDYLLVPLLNLFSTISTGIMAFYFLCQDKRKFSFQPFSYIIELFKKSYIMALSVGVNTIKTNMNVVLAKYFFSYGAVAYFDLAIKITNIFISFLDLISQAVYPKMSITRDKAFLKKIMKYSFGAGVILLISMQFSAGIIVSFLGGSQMKDSILLLRILSIIFPIYITGALLGRNALVVNGYNSTVLNSMILSGIVYVLSILIFGFVFKISLALLSITYILSFLFETLYRYLLCRRYNLI